MRKIVTIPESVLSLNATPVSVFGKPLELLIREMTETLLATRNPKGVGLAAPQVGVSQQVFLAKPTEKSPIMAFINPRIVSHDPPSQSTDEDDDGKLEGCLSIPHIWGEVERYPKLILHWQDMDGRELTGSFDGFLATIIQHEMDHLQGVLFTQRVVEQNGRLFETVKKPGKKESLQPINLQ